MEYCPGGDLRSFLDVIGCFEESEVRLYFAEMIMAVHTLHEMGFLHRDLKPDNFLIDKNGHIKLTDFGLAKSKYAVGKIRGPKVDDSPRQKHRRNISGDFGSKTVISSSISESPRRNYKENLSQSYTVNPMDIHTLKMTNSTMRSREQRLPSKAVQPIQVVLTKSELRKELGHSIVGSAEFMSPEVISGRHEGGSYYGTDCDWWSLGCLFFEMIFGAPPFSGNSAEELFQEVAQWKDNLPKLFEEQKDHISAECYSLLTGFLCDIEDRLGSDLQKIQAHPFFAGINWNKLHQMTPAFVPTSPTEMVYF